MKAPNLISAPPPPCYYMAVKPLPYTQNSCCVFPLMLCPRPAVGTQIPMPYFLTKPLSPPELFFPNATQDLFKTPSLPFPFHVWGQHNYFQTNMDPEQSSTMDFFLPPTPAQELSSSSSQTLLTTTLVWVWDRSLRLPLGEASVFVV